MVTNFFLGANSGAGFQSLYEDFVSPEDNYDILLLKGGPGVGKSSLMKYIGRQAEAAGEEVEYIWCSGDPDSLDAVRLPRIGVIAADATAPHTLEPRYPAAIDRYVNLGRFYRIEGCKADREEIVLHANACREAYTRAYRALAAATEIAETVEETQRVGWDREKLTRRAAGIIAREIPRRGGESGGVCRRFLGGLTCKGPVWRFDTVAAAADRVYVLLDSCGLGEGLLRQVAAAARERGWNTVLCPDPDRPRHLRHLLIPGLRLAFVTSREGMEYPGPAYRRLHLDALLDGDLCRRSRARCRFQRRMRRLLLEEGERFLREAKAAHDRMEAVYNAHVDFDGVRALAEEEWSRIRAWL